MKKQVVRSFLQQGQKTAIHIVAHAKWQASRGRNPSMDYKGIRNPKKALDLAIKELKIYEPAEGESIATSVERMAEIANLTSKPVLTRVKRAITSNSIIIRVKPRDSIDAILDYVVERCAEDFWVFAGWLSDPEEVKANKIRNQKKINKAMKRLPDFNSLNAVITWLDYLPMDFLVEQWKEILEVFATHRFKPIYHSFVGDLGSLAFGRWLIGQALSDLECSVHAINPLFHRDVKTWRTRRRLFQKATCLN